MTTTDTITLRACDCCRRADGTPTAWVACVGMSEVEDECPLLALARANLATAHDTEVQHADAGIAI